MSVQTDKQCDIYTNSSIVTPESQNECHELKNLFINDLQKDEDISDYVHKPNNINISKKDAQKLLQRNQTKTAKLILNSELYFIKLFTQFQIDKSFSQLFQLKLNSFTSSLN